MRFSSRYAADMNDYVIRNATIIDGTRAPRYRGDVAVCDGLISAIGDDVASGRFPSEQESFR